MTHVHGRMEIAVSAALFTLGATGLARADHVVQSAAEASDQEAPAATTDPVAILKARLDAGEVQLRFDTLFGYLPDLLDELEIETSSQSLVFSRTSLQTLYIAPWTPRAIYFNDDVYVGFIPDSDVIEIASQNPGGGSAFYTIDQRNDAEVVLRTEDRNCLSCHNAGVTAGVPGVMIRSFLTDRFGYTVTEVGDGPVHDRTPMSERFGGWYVTGTHSLPHAGNVRAEELAHEIDIPRRFLEGFDLHAGGNVTRLEGRFDPSLYPTEGSDIVALLVLAHQTRIHNLITIASEAGRGAARYRELRTLAGETGTVQLTEEVEGRIDFAVGRLLRGMLFYRVAPIGQVTGDPAFQRDFTALGPRDSSGRSLRDLSLDDRLFEYPLSFLIYSDAWDALPPIVRARAYEGIITFLTGEDHPDYPAWNPQNRAAALEILLETKPDFAEMFGATPR